MESDLTGKAAIPAWFWIAAGLALLFEAFGCYMYLAQVTMDHAGMPLDQRAMWDATPTWMMAAYAVAVWVGLIGAGLLMGAPMSAVWKGKAKDVVNAGLRQGLWCLIAGPDVLRVLPRVHWARSILWRNLASPIA